MEQNWISEFAHMAIENIFKEYPNGIQHSFTSKEEIAEPHIMHPIFYGSYDWHSSVHSHWLLVKILRSYPKHVDTQKIYDALETQFTEQKVQGEMDYLIHPARKGFERPYGWGWFLKLALEIKLLAQTNDKAKRWDEVLTPMSDFFIKAFKEYLPKLDYPIRVGTHFNSSFALFFAYEFAEYINDQELLNIIKQRAEKWFFKDSHMQTLEPCGDEFLSPVLIEALLLSKVMDKSEFASFFKTYLPHLYQKQPETLFTIVNVSDRSDGKIAHLDGLNLSRAWCMNEISNFCEDSIKKLLRDNAKAHFDSAISHIKEDYMGSHWLGSFAMLAMDVELR